MKIEGFEDLEIWQMSRELSHTVFTLTQKQNFIKDYRFKDQIRAASGSVMDNIAEGFGRGGNKEFRNFLSIALGSIEETKSQLYRAKDFDYISNEEFNQAMNLAKSIAKKTTNLLTYLKNSELKGSKYYSSKESDSIYTPHVFPDSEPITENSEPGTENQEPGT